MRSFYLHGYLRISGLPCVLYLFFLPDNFKEKNENYAISLSVRGDYFSCFRDNSGFSNTREKHLRFHCSGVSVIIIVCFLLFFLNR